MKGFLRQGIGRLQGTSVRFDLSDYAAATAAIADLEKELRELSDQEIQRRGQDLHDRARAGADANVLRIPSFALTREASRRVLGERPFDEQVMAGLALDAGHVVEMQTGEGKTLAAVMPAAFNSPLVGMSGSLHFGHTMRTRRWAMTAIKLDATRNG